MMLAARPNSRPPAETCRPLRLPLPALEPLPPLLLTLSLQSSPAGPARLLCSALPSPSYSSKDLSPGSTMLAHSAATHLVCESHTAPLSALRSPTPAPNSHPPAETCRPRPPQ